MPKKLFDYKKFFLIGAIPTTLGAIVVILLFFVLLAIRTIDDKISEYLINRCEKTNGVKINSAYGECRHSHIINAGEYVVTKLK